MTHGGSLRIYGCHENYKRDINKKVDILLAEEINCKLQSLETYLSFQFKIEKIIDKFKLFLIKQKHSGKVAAYGAAAKGNTLLNYAVLILILYPWFMMHQSQNKENICQVVISLLKIQMI